MPVDEEQFESIPWSSLIAQTNDRPWLVYVAAAAVVALVVGLLAARSLRSPATVAAVAVPTSRPSTVETTTLTSRPVTEADLQAEIQPSDDGAAAAAMRAEWFVTDYFTRDAAGGRDTELEGALGRAPPVVGPDVTTYVEWARAWKTEPEGDGRYRVSVAFRSITDTEIGFERGLVQAVAVSVLVGPAGGTRVIDLPAPASLPVAPDLADGPAPMPLPDTIVAQALELAGAWGENATVLQGTNLDGIWRVLVAATDEHGTEWSLVVPVTGEAVADQVEGG